MTRPELRTARLLLTPMGPEHLALLVELDADPAVMRFILGRARTAVEARSFWEPKCHDAAADDRGLGWWIGFVDDAFIGWWVLAPGGIGATAGGGSAAAEVGWRLKRDQWGRGLATEGAVAVLRWGFEHAGLETVWAEVHPENAGSRGVMRHLGMTPVAAGPGPDDADVTELRYEISKAQWEHDQQRGPHE